MVQVVASGVCPGTSFCTAITPALVLLWDKCELVGLAKSSAAVQFFLRLIYSRISDIFTWRGGEPQQESHREDETS